MKIDPQDISALITFLSPLMGTEAERQALLIEAFGIGPLLGSIDFAGSTRTFLPTLIRTLVAYSDSTTEIIRLLEVACNHYGSDLQQRIRGFIIHLKNKESNIRLRNTESLSQGSPSEPSKLQDLYSITIGIRNDDNLFVGTGLIVQGRILTLGSVMNSAGASPGDEINVYLPKRTMNGDRNRQARIVGSYPNRINEDYFEDHDIVILELTNTLISGVSANIGNALSSYGNSFSMFGYINHQSTDYIEGTIVGRTDLPGISDDIDCILLKHEKAVSNQMIGAGVLDKSFNKIVAVLAQSTGNNGLSLSLSPVNINSLLARLISEAA